MTPLPCVAFGLAVVLLAAAAGPGWARPPSRQHRFEPFPTQPPEQRGDRSGVTQTAASGDTTYFGGTFWNADSSRWEALPGGTWTFDSGVGSHFDHSAEGVNPFKDPSLHAYMEGWVGIDFTYHDVGYLRLVSDTDPAWTGGAVCVGSAHSESPGVLSGDWSFYCGVFPQEAHDLCYADQTNPNGYGNFWRACIGKTFTTTGAGITVNFNLVWESEDDYDFTTLEVDTTGPGIPDSDRITAVAYDGQGGGHQIVTLIPGLETRSTPGPVQIRFCFTADGSWSDEDGLFNTVCGAFSVDDIALNGGVSQAALDFEGGDDGGWVVLPPDPGPGGDWSDIVHLDDLPPQLGPCGCGLRDSVLVFTDPNSGGHPILQDNIAASPWIDLEAQGLVGTYGKVVEYRLNADLPFINYIFGQDLVQWYPYICPETGSANVSPWTPGSVFFFGGSVCSAAGPIVTDWSTTIPPGAERVRIAVGVISLCLFYSNCNGVSNTIPWYDDIRFGAYGTVDAPLISARTVDVPQDAFPSNGQLRLDAPGRVDCNNVVNAASPEIYTRLGDTLVVHGAEGGAEVHVQFAVDPGPGINQTELAAFYGTVAFRETRHGLGWYSARMDTAQIGGFPLPGSWMTAFHEEDPGFSGSDTDPDGSDPTPYGHPNSHLANDIFPDDLLTPGSRLMLFYRTRYVSGSTWYVYPDTAGGNYLEMEVLPSSLTADGTFNCILYVDHFDRDQGEGAIEAALASVLPGGSGNWENTAWDRWDVEAASSQQGSFGRPLGTAYGASLIQALQYTTIIWNSGNLHAYTLTKEDADILIPWLSLNNVRSNNLYLTGDGIANSMTRDADVEPSALVLLEDLCGVTLRCDTFREEGCPLPSSPEDATDCVQIDPISGSNTASRPLGGIHLGQGNGCPQQRSFDVIQPNPMTPNGTPLAEEIYSGDTKTGMFASVSNHVLYLSGRRYKTVVDGLSVQYRRDPGDCQFTPAAPPQAVEERLREVLDWFGSSTACSLYVPPYDDVPETPRFTTTLAPVRPNPLTLGTNAVIRFSLDREGPATVSVFDLQGRRVRTLFDGRGMEGWNEAVWDGTDDAARPVASGVYFYRLTTRERVMADKMVVVRGGRPR